MFGGHSQVGKSIIPRSVDHYSYKCAIGNMYIMPNTSHSNVITIPCLFDFVPILCGPLNAVCIF